MTNNLQSFLIAAKNKEKANGIIRKLCEKENIDILDLDINNSEKAVGIAQVRELQKKLYLKPLKSPAKCVVLEAYPGITTEAQNALLKVFEEPPENTLVVLCVESKEIVLPTILSRCKIFDLNLAKPEIEEDELKKLYTELVELKKEGIGKRLKFAENIAKEKETINLYFEKMIIATRKNLLELSKQNKDQELIPENLATLRAIQKTHQILKSTNANSRLAIENLFISLS